MAMKEIRFPKLVLFGDSLTQNSFCVGGWGAALVDHFQRRCDVLNRGFSGYTSEYNKLILPNMLKYDLTPNDAIAAVVILLGSNDSVLPCNFGNRSVTLETYADNVTNICGQFVNNGIPISRIVLITPPPIIEEMWAKECVLKGREMAFSSSRVSLFANACCKVGAELGIDTVDLHSAIQHEPNWTKFFSDGLHFSREGNQFVAHKLIPVLNTKLDYLPVILPDWKDIDANNAEKCLEEYICTKTKK